MKRAVSSRTLWVALISVIGLASSLAIAQQTDIPLVNWTVPPYAAGSSGGLTTMTDQTPPRAFVRLAVCRLLDTRPPANNPLDGDGVLKAMGAVRLGRTRGAMTTDRRSRCVA